jgi:glutamate synthase (NADPH/NADH) large chain
MLESKAFLSSTSPTSSPLGPPGRKRIRRRSTTVDFPVAGGRSLLHVMMMLVPEAWSTQVEMLTRQKKAFHLYHAALVEPWTGRLRLLLTDGVLIGATLDRNGLRPALVITTRAARRRGK